MLERRLESARCDAGRIINHIRQTYRPKRIYQWGSLLDGKRFSERSDIDIALEGLGSVQEFFAILGEAERMTNFPIDIIQIEDIHPQYAELIRSRGRIVYER
jgi:predicted nucleotidyltransferase